MPDEEILKLFPHAKCFAGFVIDQYHRLVKGWVINIMKQQSDSSDTNAYKYEEDKRNTVDLSVHRLYAKCMDLRIRTMEVLSSKLSVSASKLCDILSVSNDDLKPILANLEDDGMIHRAVDSVTGEVLLSPTSRGILNTRGLRAFAG